MPGKRRRGGRYNKRMRRRATSIRGRRRRLPETLANMGPPPGVRDFHAAFRSMGLAAARATFSHVSKETLKSFNSWYSQHSSPGRPSPRPGATKRKGSGGAGAGAKDRHDQFNQGKSGPRMNTGRGFTTSAAGYAHTQHRSVIPKWKADRRFNKIQFNKIQFCGFVSVSRSSVPHFYVK